MFNFRIYHDSQTVSLKYLYKSLTYDPVTRLIYNMVIFMDIKNRVIKSERSRIVTNKNLLDHLENSPGL